MSFTRPPHKVVFPEDFEGRIADESFMKGYLFGVTVVFGSGASTEVTVVDEYTASDDPAWVTTESNVVIATEVTRRAIDNAVSEAIDRGQFDLIIILSEANWHKCAGCTPFALQELSKIRSPLPEPYKRLMFWSNGGRGRIAGHAVELWSVERLIHELSVRPSAITAAEPIPFAVVDSKVCRMDLQSSITTIFIGSPSGATDCVMSIDDLADAVRESRNLGR